MNKHTHTPELLLYSFTSLSPPGQSLSAKGNLCVLLTIFTSSHVFCLKELSINVFALLSHSRWIFFKGRSEIEAAEAEISSYLFNEVLPPCQNLMPTLPIMHLDRWQFGRRFRGFIPAAETSSGLQRSEVRAHTSRFVSFSNISSANLSDFSPWSHERF